MFLFFRFYFFFHFRYPFSFFFFFNDTATTEIYTLSLHDALPICMALLILALLQRIFLMSSLMLLLVTTLEISRSEERFSRNAETDLVCRLLLEKKKKQRKRGPACK